MYQPPHRTAGRRTPSPVALYAAQSSASATPPPGRACRPAGDSRDMVTISNPGCSDVPAAASDGGTPYAVPRGTVRGLWQQHGSGPDAGALPALTAARYRLARRLAPDVRRGGHRLGRSTDDRRRG